MTSSAINKQNEEKHLGYHEKEIDIHCDPLILMGALAESPFSETFALYEDNGNWSVGMGEAATIITDDQQTTLSMRGNIQCWDAEIPVISTQKAFNALLIANWKAYGIVNFALARKNYDLPLSENDKQLLRFFIPVYEIRLAGHKALLRALDEPKLQALSTFVDDCLLTIEQADPFAKRLHDNGVEIASVEDYGLKNYQQSVTDALAEIKQKRYKKVILSRAIPLTDQVDITASYVSGRKANTPARSFLLKLDDLEAAGFSPETVLTVDKDGWVSTRPLAGTRALGSSKQETLQLRDELLSDSKEVYEHAISVQLAMTELENVCDKASVHITDFMKIVERKSVQHLSSSVKGQLAQGMSAWNALHALFPGVTASGIPKKEAIEAIGRLEVEPRHLYSGCVLTFDCDGVMDAAIVLRSVFKRNGQVSLQVGAGIIENSSAEREMEETREKVSSVARFLIRSD